MFINEEKVNMQSQSSITSFRNRRERDCNEENHNSFTVKQFHNEYNSPKLIVTLLQVPRKEGSK